MLGSVVLPAGSKIVSQVLYRLLLFVMHRLGFQQQPFVLDWQQAPPASSHSRVRSILITAAGLGCLNLRAKLQVSAHTACTSCHCETAMVANVDSGFSTYCSLPVLPWTSNCESQVGLVHILHIHLHYAHTHVALMCHQATLMRQASTQRL